VVRVIDVLVSPLDRSRAVLTLECGHLWSWRSSSPPPKEIACPHCARNLPPVVVVPGTEQPGW